MLKVELGAKSAVLSSDTFLKGQEFSAIRKWTFRAKRCGITRIKKIEIKLDNRSGGVSRYRLDIAGDYSEPFRYPWYACYSHAWEIKTYGIGKGHKGGVWGQFPDVDWEGGELDFVMEQLWAAGMGMVDLPQPGFKIRTQIVPAFAVEYDSCGGR